MVSRRDTKTPIFEEVTSALKNRSKALKYKFRHIELTFGKDESPKPSLNWLEVTFWRSRHSTSPRISLKIWEDRWSIIDSREGGRSGWKWEHTFEGRLVGNLTGREVILSVEEFDKLLSGDSDSSQLSQFWRDKLLTGPLKIVNGRP